MNMKSIESHNTLEYCIYHFHDNEKIIELIGFLIFLKYSCRCQNNNLKFKF